MRARTAAALLALALAGCAAAPTGGRPPPAVPPILDGAALGARAANQVVRAAFQDRELTLQCAVQVDGRAVTVVGVDAMGRRAFTIGYDGARVAAESGPMVPEGFSPEYLLADVELALWPLEALQAGYAGTEWSVREPYAGARRLYRRDRLVAEVHYTGDPWATRYWVANVERGYVLAVDPQPAGR
ncbi:MAG: DUF3261 domain-containing protein [Gammaproteobacteria bacterium]